MTVNSISVIPQNSPSSTLSPGLPGRNRQQSNWVNAEDPASLEPRYFECDETFTYPMSFSWTLEVPKELRNACGTKQTETSHEANEALPSSPSPNFVPTPSPYPTTNMVSSANLPGSGAQGRVRL